jgi:hypothetical protein
VAGQPEIEEFQWTEGKDGRKVSFGMDASGNLYVNGRRVLMEQRLRLSWLQALWAGIAALFVVGASAATIMDVYLSHKDWWDVLLGGSVQP